MKGGGPDIQNIVGVEAGRRAVWRELMAIRGGGGAAAILRHIFGGNLSGTPALITIISPACIT